MPKKSANLNLRKASTAKKDEFYTQLSDIEKELRPNNSLKGATLKIFSQYSKKKDNQLNYEDKAMVDVLLDFTRTSEHKIAFSFWEKNRTIMELAINLIKETNDFLELLYSVKY